MKKALIITDMIDVYVKSATPLIPENKKNILIQNIKQCIELARKNNIPVIYSNSSFRQTDPIFKIINNRDQSVNTNESPIVAELKPEKNDIVSKKRGFDAFWKSDLENHLQKLQIKELFLTGCQTDCCIRETAVTASHMGYDVYVIEDCCETNREFGQVTAIRFLKMCTKGVIKLNKLPNYFSAQ